MSGEALKGNTMHGIDPLTMTKYAKEIKLGIMSKMKIVGDGDEGIIGYDFHYNDFKR